MNFPINYRYGYTYVPSQVINEVFSPEVGLASGTIFPELVDPYAPNDSHRMIEFLKERKD